MTRHLYSEFLSLQLVGIIVGLLLVGLHLYAFLAPAKVQDLLKQFPRHKQIGIVLLVIDLIWCFWLISNIDLGEFYTLKKPLQMIIPIAGVLIIIYVDEFLAVRALGILLLLLSCPILEAAFLKPPMSRLLLSGLAYVWILFALFWVGMPYLLRDQIRWASGSEGRWKGLAAAGIAYGALILVCAFAFWSTSAMAAQ
jgi:hypothetical protein